MAFQTLSPDTVTSIVTEVARDSVNRVLEKERRRFENNLRVKLGRRLLVFDKASQGEHTPKHSLANHLRDLIFDYQGEIKSDAESILVAIETYHLEESDRVTDINDVPNLGTKASEQLVVDLIGDNPVFREVDEAKHGFYIIHEGKYYISSAIYKDIVSLIDRIVTSESDKHLRDIKDNAVEVIKDSRKPVLARIFLAISGRNRNLRFEDSFATDLIETANNDHGRLYDLLLSKLLSKETVTGIDPTSVSIHQYLYGVDKSSGISYGKVHVNKEEEDAYYFLSAIGSQGTNKVYIRNSIVLLTRETMNRYEEEAEKLVKKNRRQFKSLLISALSV